LETHSQTPLLRNASDPLPPPAHGFALLPQSVQYTSELLVVPKFPKLTGVRTGMPVKDVAVMFPLCEPSFITAITAFDCGNCGDYPATCTVPKGKAT